MGIRTVILDLDQTLLQVDHDQPWAAACAEVCGLGAEQALPLLHQGRGTPIPDMLRQGGVDDPQLHRQVYRRFWQQVRAGPLPAMPGAHQLLLQLRQQDLHRVFLSTGSPPELVKQVFGLHGWEECFDLVLPSPPGAEKGPGHYARMLEHSDWEQTQFGESALSLGDGLLDMRLAREHGVGHRVGFLPPGSAPDWGQQLLAAGATHLVQALDQVPQLLQSGLGRRGARIG